MRRWIGALVIGVTASTAVGCATVPMASVQDNTRMKQWQPSPGNSLIDVYRSELIGYAVHMEVDLDGRRWGTTVAKSYMVWEVPPGRHTLVSHAENDAMLVLDTLPGRRYFVWQEVRMGLLYARSELGLVPDDIGVDGVWHCSLIAMPLPAPQPAPPPPPAQALAVPTS